MTLTYKSHKHNAEHDCGLMYGEAGFLSYCKIRNFHGYQKPLNSFTLLLLFLSYISMHILYLFMHIKLKWTFILVSVNDKALYTSQVLIMQLQRLLALKAGCCTAG